MIDGDALAEGCGWTHLTLGIEGYETDPCRPTMTTLCHRNQLRPQKQASRGLRGPELERPDGNRTDVFLVFWKCSLTYCYSMAARAGIEPGPAIRPSSA